MIDCYAWKTGNGRKALLMLAECGLPHNIIPIDITRGEHRTAEYRALNPNQLIPTIVDHDAPGGPLTLFESGAILLYLAEKAGKLLPATARERAACHQWMFWHSATFVPAVIPLHMIAQGRAPRDPAVEETAYGRAKKLYGMLESRLAQSAHLAGDAYSVADVMMAPMLTRRGWHGIDLADFPAIRRWYEAIVARPAARDAFSDVPLK